MAQQSDRNDNAILYNSGIINYRRLSELTSRSEATVYCVICKLKDGETLEHRLGAGRPKAFGEIDSRRLTQTLRWHPKMSVHKFPEVLAANGTEVSDMMV